MGPSWPPVDPGVSAWQLPDPSVAEPGQELIALGGDLSPAMLLAGYRAGIFAMPEGSILGWWSPDPRGVLVPGEVHVSRSLNRALGCFTVSRNLAFARVLDACADPMRPHGWITKEYRQAYLRLHQMGWAHSIEVWDTEHSLAGGLFGVELGGLFAAESKFHHATDASKVAVVALADMLNRQRPHGRLIDVQWSTAHLATLGVREISRIEYLKRAAFAQSLPSSRPDHGSAGPSRIRWRKA